MDTVHTQNRRLQGVLIALRELGQTTIPALVLLKMVKTQKTIMRHLETVQETNNLLIKKHGEVNEETGGDHITPEMDGWAEFQQEASILQLVEFDVGEPFVLYEREHVPGEVVVGWTDPVKTPLELSANVIVDMGDLLVIDLLASEVEEDKIAGHIESDDPML